MTTNQNIQNIFFRFLKDNNAYRAYISNVEKNNKKDFLKDFFLRSRPDRWLNTPFVWERTEEGHNFWFNLSHQWTQIIYMNSKKEEHYVKSHF